MFVSLEYSVFRGIIFFLKTGILSVLFLFCHCCYVLVLPHSFTLLLFSILFIGCVCNFFFHLSSVISWQGKIYIFRGRGGQNKGTVARLIYTAQYTQYTLTGGRSVILYRDRLERMRHRGWDGQLS